MPVTYLKTVARLEGACDVEEAEGLLEWLQEHPKGKLNLKECEHLHSAVLQVLLALRPCISSCPRPGSPVAAMFSAVWQEDC